MKRMLFVFVWFWMAAVSGFAGAGTLDDIVKGAAGAGSGVSPSGRDPSTIVSGLKEALAMGTENAVRSLSKTDGFFGNRMVKILLPEKIRKAAGVAAKLGYREQVDGFVLSMNRAAEAAVPGAAALFAEAVRTMSFDDARRILNGGDTAATEYFRSRTYGKLYDAFKPVVVSSMNGVGVAKAYRDMIAPYESLPLVPKESLDLDHYVTSKALEGLFLMVGMEEKKIRTDPAARVTDLLKTVFGR